MDENALFPHTIKIEWCKFIAFFFSLHIYRYSITYLRQRSRPVWMLIWFCHEIKCVWYVVHLRDWREIWFSLFFFLLFHYSVIRHRTLQFTMCCVCESTHGIYGFFFSPFVFDSWISEDLQEYKLLLIDA